MEYTVHWVESDDGISWFGFEDDFDLFAFEGATKLAAATAMVSLLGLMM